MRKDNIKKLFSYPRKVYITCQEKTNWDKNLSENTSSEPPRRDFLKYVATGVGALAIGAIAGYVVGSGNVTTSTSTTTATTTVPGPTVTNTVTQTATTTATTTTTTTAPFYEGSYPSTQEGLTSMINAATELYIKRLKEEALKSSTDWKQFQGKVSSLNCSIRQSTDNDIYARMGLIFEELSGIKVNFDFTPEVQQREKVSIDILQKTGVYHLPIIDNMHLPKYVAAGCMEGLNQYIEDPKLTDKTFYQPNDFYDMVFKSGNAPPYGAKGELYYVPSIFHHTMQYYNKAYFDAKGLTNQDIDTFDSLLTSAGKLNNPGAQQYGYSSRGMRGEGMNIFTWQTFHRGFGGEWIDSSMKPIFNSDATVAAIKAYVDLMTQYGPPGVENYDFAATLSSAGEGRVAIGLDCDCWGTMLWNPVNAKPGVLGNIFAYRVPKGPNGRHAGFFAWAFGVPVGVKTVEEKKATWLWCQLAHSPYGIAVIQANTLSILPSRKAVWNLEGFASICPPNDYLKYKNLTQNEDAYYDDRPPIPEWPEIGDIAGIALSSALAKERTPKEAADWAQGQMYDTMHNAGYY